MKSPLFKEIVLITSFVFVVISFSYSQRSEIGVFGGGSYYLGDLNPGKHFGNTSPAIGLVYRYNATSRWVLKANAIFGSLIGDDASSVGADKQRNLSFKSNIFDVSGQIELNFFPYFTGSKKNKFTPYIFTGISVFNFKPKAEYNGEWYDLRPLGTEGQGTKTYSSRKTYGLTQLAIPFGIGIKLSLNKIICIGAEWSMRKTFTDYIDDVSTTYVDPVKLSTEKGLVAASLSNRSIDIPGSAPLITGMQRGDPKTKDWYSFAMITFTAKIYTKKNKGCHDYQKHSNYDEFLLN